MFQINLSKRIAKRFRSAQLSPSFAPKSAKSSEILQFQAERLLKAESYVLYVGLA